MARLRVALLRPVLLSAAAMPALAAGASRSGISLAAGAPDALPRWQRVRALAASSLTARRARLTTGPPPPVSPPPADAMTTSRMCSLAAPRALGWLPCRRRSSGTEIGGACGPDCLCCGLPGDHMCSFSPPTSNQRTLQTIWLSCLPPPPTSVQRLPWRTASPDWRGTAPARLRGMRGMRQRRRRGCGARCSAAQLAAHSSRSAPAARRRRRSSGNSSPWRRRAHPQSSRRSSRQVRGVGAACMRAGCSRRTSRAPAPTTTNPCTGPHSCMHNHTVSFCRQRRRRRRRR